jgi:hydroxyacylglutathione hydrolase
VSDDRQIGHVTVLTGERGGRYPDGNSLLVIGGEETVIIDPSLTVVARRDRLPPVDRVLIGHSHEDHLAGGHLFADAPWLVHELDLPALQSVDDLIVRYGFGDPAIDASFRETVLRRFHYSPRPGAIALRDGDVLDLGGGVRISVIHAPGHTGGHCVFLIEPDGVLALGDVDLSSFGPYYGDAVSSLEEFERTLAEVRALSARWYATFHHVGVIDGQDAFVERLDRFAAVIGDREQRLVEYLREPRTLAEIVAHRFVYRPRDDVLWADAVERRSMGQHLERLCRAGRVAEVEPGRFQTADGAP